MTLLIRAAMPQIGLTNVERLELESLFEGQTDYHPVPVVIGQIPAGEIDVIADHIVDYASNKVAGNQALGARSERPYERRFLNETRLNVHSELLNLCLNLNQLRLPKTHVTPL